MVSLDVVASVDIGRAVLLAGESLIRCFDALVPTSNPETAVVYSYCLSATPPTLHKERHRYFICSQ